MSTRQRERILDWDASIDSLTYEQILGISEHASVEDCRSAYYEFAQRFHPDMHPNADVELRDALCRIFQLGAEAYRVLTHPALRKRWARLKSQGAHRLTEEATSAGINLQSELPNLHVQCRSGGAKLEARQAAISFAHGKLALAVEHLERALMFEGGANLDLVRCLEAIRDLGVDASG